MALTKSKIQKEIDKLNLPKNITIDAIQSHHIGGNNEEKYLIQIINGSKTGNFETFLQFWYEKNADKKIELKDIKFSESQTGLKYGKQMVGLMEKIAKHLKCPTSYIEQKDKENFWTSLGYENKGTYFRKELI